jgi:hypothetical protein
MNHIPSKYRKPAFDRFAPVIGQAIRQFPRALVVDPSTNGLTPDSYASALRNAIKAKRDHGHCSSAIDEMLWAKNEKFLVVSMRSDGMIVLGDAATVKEPAGNKFGSQAVPTVELKNNYFLTMVCDLLSQRAFHPAINVKIRGVDQDTRNRLENQFDIAFLDADEPDTYILL